MVLVRCAPGCASASRRCASRHEQLERTPHLSPSFSPDLGCSKAVGLNPSQSLTKSSLFPRPWFSLHIIPNHPSKVSKSPTFLTSSTHPAAPPGLPGVQSKDAALLFAGVWPGVSAAGADFMGPTSSADAPVDDRGRECCSITAWMGRVLLDDVRFIRRSWNIGLLTLVGG